MYKNKVSEKLPQSVDWTEFRKRVIEYLHSTVIRMLSFDFRQTNKTIERFIRLLHSAIE
jgi:hypothetical protein